MDSRANEREAMVTYQLQGRGISDERVLKAMLTVERHLFVPEPYQSFAYDDRPLPIGQEQTISQPYMVGFMLQALNLSGNEKVLEVGTGSGYVTALLGHLASEVYTVDVRPDLAKRAREILEVLVLRNIYFKTGDGLLGWPEHAPFHAVIVSACLRNVPGALLEQIGNGGRVIAPLAHGGGQILVLLEKKLKGIRRTNLMQVSFVLASGDSSSGKG